MSMNTTSRVETTNGTAIGNSGTLTPVGSVIDPSELTIKNADPDWPAVAEPVMMVIPSHSTQFAAVIKKLPVPVPMNPTFQVPTSGLVRVIELVTKS